VAIRENQNGALNSNRGEPRKARSLRLDKEVSGLAFVWLLLAEILTVAGFGFPHDDVGGPDTLRR
jgi:hypothetical protein